MMPGDEIELEEDEYVAVNTSIKDGSIKAKSGLATDEGGSVKFGISDCWPPSQDGWCATVELNGKNENGEVVSTTLILNRQSAETVVKELQDFFGMGDE